MARIQATLVWLEEATDAIETIAHGTTLVDVPPYGARTRALILDWIESRAHHGYLRIGWIRRCGGHAASVVQRTSGSHRLSSDGVRAGRDRRND
jgi:hypothetical protein